MEYKDLVKRDGVHYKKLFDVPFTWKIDEETQGSFKNGKIYGFWLPYWDNGQLMIKVNHKNGILEGSKV